MPVFSIAQTVSEDTPTSKSQTRCRAATADLVAGHQGGEQERGSKSRTLRWLLVWTSFITVVFWLPAVRGAFDGPSYQWQLFGLGGRGTSGDYWFPVVMVLIALFVIAQAWRGATWPVVGVVMLWHLSLFAGSVWLAVSVPEVFRFRGDTLGIDILLAWLGPMLFGLGAIISITIVRRSYRQRNVSAPAWDRRNQRWLLFLIACLPVQFALL